MIEIKGVCKSFALESKTFYALRDLDLTIQSGEFVCIAGKSGSGKSTLLNLIAAIDQPTSGSIRVADSDLADIGPKDLDLWRGKYLGIVFQFFQLIPTLTVWENVVLPMDFAGRSKPATRKKRALALLDLVGMSDSAHKFPAILSGGEKQRVAIARALANDPPILLGDEPTGNLDQANAESVYDLFAQLNKQGKTVVIVSHDSDSRAYAGRSLFLEDGRFQSEAEVVAHA